MYISHCIGYLVQMAYVIFQKNFSLSIKSLSKRFRIGHTQSINVSGLRVKVCICLKCENLSTNFKIYRTFPSPSPILDFFFSVKHKR